MRPEPSSSPPAVAVMGTFDTKAEPLLYLAGRIAAEGGRPLLLDVGVAREVTLPPGAPGPLWPAAPEAERVAWRQLPRGEAVERMSLAARARLGALVASGEAGGAVGVGGSGGTTICAAAMRGLDYGVPKLLVSTLASGNTRWHVDISDIVMMPSVVDVAGLNPLLAMVLDRAASAITAMVRARRPLEPSGRPVVGVTMYGTTTAGVSRACELIAEGGLEPWIFHASGVGGRTLERLIALGHVQGTMDMTLAEIGGHLVGGLHDGGPDRLSAAGALGLPQVVVPGAADTVVLPPRAELPERFRGRTLNLHNPTMVTMRTSVDENVAIARFIADKLNRAKGPVTVVLPLGGLSSLDRPGKIFFDPAANAALFETLRSSLSAAIPVVEDPHHIDDPPFAARVASLMARAMAEEKERSKRS